MSKALHRTLTSLESFEIWRGRCWIYQACRNAFQRHHLTRHVEYKTLISVMQDVLQEPAKLRSAVPRIQAMIWHGNIAFPNERAEELLRDLAHDLDYWQPDELWRSPPKPSLFGNAKALEHIRATVEALAG